MIGNKNNLINWLLKQKENTIFEIKEIKNKRSLNANSYAWVLITKIASVMNLSKEEIYLLMLKNYGQSLLIPVPKNSKPDGYFKYYEFVSRREMNGVIVDFYKVYKGSSDYDTKEMSELINGIVQECKNLEIETLEDIKINQLINEWN